MTLKYAGIAVELREILLRDKPPSLLAASPKATVPVLVLPDGNVIDESYDIMRWALENSDPDHWWRYELATETQSLVKDNDLSFKKNLDRYKYADRYPEHPQVYYRSTAEEFLRELEQRLTSWQYLQADRITFSDIAIFPFVRQFALVDRLWFDQAPYPRLQDWLQWFLNSELFTNVMTKYPLWREATEDE